MLKNFKQSVILQLQPQEAILLEIQVIVIIHFVLEIVKPFGNLETEILGV